MADPESTVTRLLELRESSGAMKPRAFMQAYAQVFASTEVNSLLEIGIHQGGSIRLWREFFGQSTGIYAFDINPECVSRGEGVATATRTGSQADKDFLQQLGRDWGSFDLIIDDGSHRSEHVLFSLETLFPYLSPGGAYIVEDMFTSYWSAYGGGLREPHSFVEQTKNMIDLLYLRYMGEKFSRHHDIPTERIPGPNSISDEIDSIQFLSCGIVCFRKKI